MNERIPLARLKAGQAATVQSLAAQGSIRRRLQDIGLIEGTTVECVGISPLGDPAAYLIRGAVVALRNSDAARVFLDSPRTSFGLLEKPAHSRPAVTE